MRETSKLSVSTLNNKLLPKNKKIRSRSSFKRKRRGVRLSRGSRCAINSVLPERKKRGPRNSKKKRKGWLMQLAVSFKVTQSRLRSLRPIERR